MKTWLASFLVVGIALLGSSAPAADPAPGVIRISVPDMVCEGCAFSVTKALKKVEGVTDAHVDPKAKIALVKPKPSAQITDAVLKKAVEDAGYEAKQIERLEMTFAKAKAELEKASS